MWELCNDILHHFIHAKGIILILKINQQIQAIYKAGPQALPCKLKHLLCELLENILCLPFVIKQQWVESMEVARKKKLTHDYGLYLAE